MILQPVKLEASTRQLMTDEEIINLVHTENDAQEEELDDEEEEFSICQSD